MKDLWEFTENLGEFVYVSDADNYELVYMNKKLREMLKVSGEEYKGKKCYEILQHCGSPCAICNNDEIRPNEFCEWLYYNPILKKNLSIKDTLIEKDGRRYRMEIAININPQEWQAYVVKDDEDLTAIANEALRIALKKENPEESIALYLEYIGKILNGERTYIFEKNPNGTDSNTYEWVSTNAIPMKERLQNLPPEICATWYKNFSEDKCIVIKDLEEIRENDPAVYETLKMQDISSLVVVPLYETGKIIGFYGVDNPAAIFLDRAQDVLQVMAYYIAGSIRQRNLIFRLRLEEQKKTAIALQQEMTSLVASQTREYLDIINEIIGSGMWTMNFDEQGKMQEVSWHQKFREMIGFENTEDFPDTFEAWSSRIYPEDKEATLAAYWDCVKGKSEFDVKYRLLKKNGEYDWFRMRGETSRYLNGSTRLITGTFVNITEKHKNELALEEACRAANRANAAKTEFLASMSHDIRTPLNAIIGMTAIAAANLDDIEKVQHCLSKITVSSKHLLNLINEVLDMNKIESGKLSLNKSTFSLVNLIEDFISISKPLVKNKRQEFFVDIRHIEHENVIGDASRIQQCLMNFMSNAVKYTGEEGRIKLLITERPTNRAKFTCYEFIFEDNGIGMSEEFLEHLFEPFTRASDDERAMKQQGTGLGMSITRNIVQMMDGDIKVESRLNKGTKFTVTIFLEIQDKESAIKLEALSNLPILVVDDDKIACESTCFILNELGMRGEWVLSGKEAVQKVMERHEEAQDFFAVIVDWKMPGMDGVQTTRAIREAVGKDVPIIIISAYDWSDIESDAKEAGANAFISKPIFKSKVARTFSELTSKENPASDESNSIPLEKYREKKFSGKRVLLAEDNEVNAEIAKEILGMAGLEVEVAWNGKEAVEKLFDSDCANPRKKFDIVFMDIQMPIMDGYGAATKIRQADSEYLQKIPIVAMTANAFAEDVQRARSVGMNEHVAKPLDFDRLLSVLNKFL